MESILQSIKKLLGIDANYDAFDGDIAIHINTVFAILNQMNVGPSTGFFINDSTSLWSEYTQEINVANMVKTFVYLKVRLLFDPPTSPSVIESINRTLSELEFRLYYEGDKNNIIVEPPIEEVY
jgi:hypothetical protein